MKNIKLAIFTLILLSFVLCTPPPQAAQTVLTGTWKANDDNWNWNHKNKDKDKDDFDEAEEKNRNKQIQSDSPQVAFDEVHDEAA